MQSTVGVQLWGLCNCGVCAVICSTQLVIICGIQVESFAILSAGKGSVVGEFRRDGERSGRPLFKATSGGAALNHAFIYWEESSCSDGQGMFWALTGNDERSGWFAYINRSDTPTVPLDGWETLDGQDPPPLFGPTLQVQLTALRGARCEGCGALWGWARCEGVVERCGGLGRLAILLDGLVRLAR